MRARGMARLVARLSCAVAAGLVPSAPLAAQQAGSAELDPTAPLDPMPGLGVAWPDMQQTDEPPEVTDGAEAATAPRGESGSPELERQYAVAIEGLEQVGERDQLVEAFEVQSALHANREDLANAAQIDRRSRSDAELLAELLRSRGYFDAMVEPRVQRQGQVLFVLLDVEPGVQYRFASVDLPGLETAGAEAKRLRQSFAVEPGDAVIAEDVIAAGAALKIALGERGYALSEIGEQQIEIDHQTHLASLTLPVAPGPAARFGTIAVSGRPAFSATHVAQIARFEPGEPFQRSRLDDLRRALIATGLVASAEVRLIPSADRGAVDVAVHLEPAPMRTIAGEVGYGTGEGARAEASWQHRNFTTPEGALTLRAVAGTREQLAAAEFRRSNFRARDQVLSLHALGSHIQYDAYEAKTVLLGAGLERQSNIIWRKKWTWSIGADLIGTDERGVFDDFAAKETRTFLIAALPATLRYDGSNDLLDPTEGFRLGGRISPEFSPRGDSNGYARAQLDGSVYRPVSERTVLAGRVRLGTIVGAGLASLAPSRRIFSGGGGSVRGYGYQRVGPRDTEGDPIGGRGLAEFALEGRIRLNAFGGNFGLVPFLDGGSLTTDAVPDFTDWHLGAGVGLRYYSSFGPIRIDVGTPLNRREGNAPVAVTVSLGQAF